MTYSYKQLRAIRELLLEEIKAEVLSLTVDHYLLVEARLANIIAAGADAKSVADEKANFKSR